MRKKRSETETQIQQVQHQVTQISEKTEQMKVRKLFLKINARLFLRNKRPAYRKGLSTTGTYIPIQSPIPQHSTEISREVKEPNGFHSKKQKTKE